MLACASMTVEILMQVSTDYEGSEQVLRPLRLLFQFLACLSGRLLELDALFFLPAFTRGQHLFDLLLT